MANPLARVGEWAGNQLSGLVKAFSEPKSRRGETQLSHAMGSYSYGGIGNGWTVQRHEVARQFRHWAYVAINTICKTFISHAPFCGLMQDEKDSRSKYLSPGERNKLLGPTSYDSEHIEILGRNHPLNRLLRDPNEPDAEYVTWYSTLMGWAMHGIAYWWIPPNGLGLPGEVWVPPPHWVYPQYYGTGKWVDVYEIKTDRGGTILRIPPEEMIVFRAPHPWDMRDGYSPMFAGSNWIDIENSLVKAQLASMKNGARPSMAVELSEKYAEPKDQELDRIYAKFFARYSGEHNDGKPIITPPGSKVQMSGFTPREMNFQESSTLIRDMVLALFGVPYTAAMIVGGATHENYNESMRGYHCGTIHPLQIAFGQILTEKLAKRYDERAFVAWKDFTPLSPAEEHARIETRFKCGAMTPNQISAYFGGEPVGEGGDKTYIPRTLISLEDAQMPMPTQADFGTSGSPQVKQRPKTNSNGVANGRR